jgi:glycosyltransferase involved in cell wall biosynthesis
MSLIASKWPKQEPTVPDRDGSARTDAIKISAVIAAKNEAGNIEACIKSLENFADEVVVVDDDSTDETAAIAIACGARVVKGRRSSDDTIERLFMSGFLAARGEWIFRSDADERMAPALAERLKRIAAEGEVRGVTFARRNVMFGDWPRHGGWFVSQHLHFFRASAWDRDWKAVPHTYPAIAGKVTRIEATPEVSMLHLDYDNVPQFVGRTLQGYAKAEADVLFACGRKPSMMRMVLLPIRKFVGRYFFRQGFRDGTRGLILAGLLGCHVFLIEAILWDLHRRNRGLN